MNHESRQQISSLLGNAAAQVRSADRIFTLRTHSDNQSREEVIINANFSSNGGIREGDLVEICVLNLANVARDFQDSGQMLVKTHGEPDEHQGYDSGSSGVDRVQKDLSNLTLSNGSNEEAALEIDASKRYMFVAKATNIDQKLKLSNLEVPTQPTNIIHLRK